MPKEQLKDQIRKGKGNFCVITGEALPKSNYLIDTHRAPSKAENGPYTFDSTFLSLPTAHQEIHGTLRVREEEMEELKSIVDSRGQIIKLKIKIENQLSAYERRTDHLTQQTISLLKEQLKQIEKEENRHTKELEKQLAIVDHPLARAAMSVRGVGPVIAANCIVYIDIAGVFPETIKDKNGKKKPHPRAGEEKCRHASSLWAYVGLDKPAHSRYKKGEAGGGNKTLRTALYQMATVQMQSRGPYREIYDRKKQQLENSDKIVWDRNVAKEWHKVKWKDAKPSHRHGAALRDVVKHFLADYWFVGRTIYNLPTNPIYAEAILGTSHKTIKPEERGWIY